jgi:cell division protein FtsI (penicillin-binding protein 3)
VAGYRIAGKTGTARKSVPGRGYVTDQRIPSFVGFAPARRPRLAGLVVIDTPRGSRYYGGQVAAPVFATIMAEALTALRVPPDEDPLLDEPAPVEGAVTLAAAPKVRAETPAPPEAAPRARLGTHADQVPDVLGLGLREAVRSLADRGCRVRVSGSGVVVAQDPAPGTPLPSDAACALTLASEAQVVAQGTAP